MRSDKELEKDQMKEKTEHMCKKMKKEDLLLYAVTDRHWLNGETLYSQVEKTLEGGTTFVQLREKELDEAHFLKEAKEIKELCARYRVPFVINDNVDIALEMDADGVHVGQSDMEADDVRAKLGPDKIIGVSAQTVEQAVRAIAAADVLLIGGTSLTVYPACSLLRYFNGEHLVVLNRDATQIDEQADLCIRDKIGAVLSQIVLP